jgi:N-acetylated-alpha-linked acidic dipeptidase
MLVVRATALLLALTLSLPVFAFQQPATKPAPAQKPPAQQDVNKSNAPVAPEKETEPTQASQAAPAALSADVHPLEEKFRSIPEPARIRESMKRMSARPHHVGSPYDKDNAEWILARYKEYGWDAKIEQFDVLFPTPKERMVEMVSPKPFRLKLQEPPIAIDPTSGQTAEQLPTYNAYSIDGDVTGPLVYVNYGRPQDYEELERYGISVKGAIVIARYGQSWRGIKPKVAAEHGAIGCIIYSDPKDDGYFDDEVFPKGPMRNPDGVQRGSVADMPTHPGDPLSPGFGSVPGAKRLSLNEAKTLTKIPVLPVSYGDARPLLESMTGPVAPETWRGGLPITYHIGPGATKVHMKLAFNWDTKPLYDVIARIQGSTYPDEWIVRGNHHDAWVNGAEDPVSGQSAQLEEARAFGELLKTGWRPKRTIIYAAWDGEEPGLLGSTEWAETHADELQKKAVLYINTDGNDRGFLGASGSHTLEHFMNSVARTIQDPETHSSVWKRMRAQEIDNAKSADDRKEIRERADLRIRALGSGSDYTPFLQHLGIASLDLGYGGEDDGGIYHSIYDDFYWYTNFSDKDFVYGRALAQTVGTAVLRLSDDDVLPFEFSNLADTVHSYIKDLQKLLKDRQDKIKEQNQQIDEGTFAEVNDPQHKLLPPKKEQVPPAINFASLENAAQRLSEAADRYQRALTAAKGKLTGDRDALAALNAKLIQSERQFLAVDGLKGRPWFKHMLYAPGYYTGYAVKTMPGVRENIEQKQYADADAEASKLAAVLDKQTAWIDSASAVLEGVK